MITSDEEFASCERSDRILSMFLGRDLQQATFRIGIFGILICVIVALVSELAI